MAPITNNGEEVRKITGFVLSLEDITGEIDADSERDRILQKMIDAVQNSLGKLHRGISVRREAIDQVSSDLEEYLAMARQLYSEHQKAYGNRENVLADTLLRLIANDLLERFAIQASSTVDGSVASSPVLTSTAGSASIISSDASAASSDISSEASSTASSPAASSSWSGCFG